VPITVFSDPTKVLRLPPTALFAPKITLLLRTGAQGLGEEAGGAGGEVAPLLPEEHPLEAGVGALELTFVVCSSLSVLIVPKRKAPRKRVCNFTIEKEDLL
jgi:hypothetical protein